MKFSRLFFLLLCTGTGARAAITVSNISATATQALLPYTAPDSSPCTVEVSESPSYSPLVHDVDPTLFQNANLDSRPGGVSRGTERVFVLGKRSAEIGLDTVRYSRALQTATEHYYRITCSGQTSTGTFTTSTIPFGNTYAEPEASDRLNPGSYAYPTLSTSDRSQTVIDPQTGVYLARLSMPSDVAYYGNNTRTFNIGRSSAWLGVPNLIAGASAATVSGSTGKLFLGLDSTQGSLGAIRSYAESYGNNPWFFPYYQVQLSVAVNPGGSAPATAADATYSTCLTLDAVNCYSGSSVFTTVASPNFLTSTFGTQNAIDLWQSTPGTKIPDFRDEGARAGNSTCDGSTTVTQTGGETYSIHWGPGSTLTIAGTDYTIARVNHTGQVTLTTACAPVTNAPSHGNNFGVLVWKNSASADTLAINGAIVNWKVNAMYGTGVGGGTEYASPSTLIGPNGNPGYNYRSGDGTSGINYWVDDVTGEGHLRGTISNSYEACGIFNGQFYAADPDIRVCGGGSGLSLIKFYMPFDSPTSIQLYAQAGPCNTAAPNSPPYSDQQPCFVPTDLTPGTSITALTQSFTSNPAYAPQFNSASYANIGPVSSDNLGNIMITAQNNYGSLGWAIIYNPAATSNAEGGSAAGPIGNHGCVGGGNPGCVVAAIPAWARPGCRWCTVKGGAFAADGWSVFATYPWGNDGIGTGPYSVPVVDGAVNGTINYFDGSSSLQACPQNPFGAAGNRCTTVTIGAEPSSPVHGGTETGLPGEIGVMQTGDYVTLDNNAAHEVLMIIKKVPGAVAGTWVVTLLRDINSTAATFGATGLNPTLYMQCNSNQTPAVFDSGGGWYWDALNDPHGMNADGTHIPPDGSSQGDHYFWSNGTQGTSSQNANETRCLSGIYGCYTTRLKSKFSSFAQEIRSTPTAVVERFPRFSAGSQDVFAIQSHPTGGGILAEGSRANYMFDGRPFYGGLESGSVSYNGSNPGTLVAGQLYKFSSAQMPNLDLPFRKWTPTAAFTGNLPLVDVSSPATGNVIPIYGTGSYTYCVAAAPNECRTGSAAGDVYVNAPYVRFPFCYQAPQNGNLSDDYDICIGGSSSVRDAIVQLGMDKVDNFGLYQRVISKFVRARTMSVFYTPYVFPDGKWLTFESHLPGDGSLNRAFLVAKIPPPAEDSVDRTGFQSMQLVLPGRSDIQGAYVQFGYVENGSPTSYFCTSRAEACVATASVVNQAAPFSFKQTEAQTWAPASCTSGCTISIPALSQRALYYQYVYTSGDGSVAYTSPANVVLVP